MNSSDPLSDRNARLARWFAAAIIVSILLHGLLFVYFRLSKLERFEFTNEAPRLISRPFEVKQAQIDPKSLEPEREVALNERTPKQALPELPELARERPDLEKGTETVQLSPQTTEKPLDQVIKERPDVTQSGKGGALTPGRNRTVEQELEATRKGMMEEVAPMVAPGSKLPLPTRSGSRDGEGSGRTGDAPGFSDLDELLTRSGPLSGSVAPLNMPGGALFEYDSAELVPESIQTLKKLGELIERNPGATFGIEGHTDTFGSPEYNQTLSLARAEAVKRWLVDSLHLDPARITTRGYGSERLLVPSGTPEEQHLNRRVEIEIRPPPLRGDLRLPPEGE